MQLQRLIDESDVTDTEMMKSKLRHFRREIEYMECQLEYLQTDIEAGAVSAQISQPDPDSVKYEKNTGEISVSSAQITPAQSEQSKQLFLNYANDLEKTIGKSLMGIFASVLIFISLILFATLLLPYFNDIAKMITMYLISLAFTGAGLWKLQKNKDNKFYMALTGCGIGAVYISLLLSNMYFKVIGDITLYVLIGIWAAGVCFLAKFRNRIFQIIGQLGILIAMIFGCMICLENSDVVKFTALVIFYFISSGVFYLVHYDREFANNLMHHIFNAVNFVILYLGCTEIIGKGMNMPTLLILLMIAINIGVALYSRLEKTGVSFGIFTTVYVFFFLNILLLVLADNDIFAIAAYLICIVLNIFIEWKRANKNTGKYIIQSALILFAAYGLEMCEVLFAHGIVILLILPFLLLGFYRKNIIYKYAGMILFAFYPYLHGVGGIERFLLGCLVIVTAFYLIYKNKDQYSIKYKYCVHVLALLFLLFAVRDVIYELIMNHDAADTGSLMAITFFNIIMMKSALGKNPESGEKEKETFYNIINAIAMLIGLAAINAGHDGFVHLFIIITTFAAFMVNAKNILDKRNNIYGGIYVGLKFTILMVTILHSFDAVNYVISAACLVLAILNIVLGFKYQYKSLRIFGLGLSMVSTFKLIMIDINYDNTLGNALSFFASGILCFVISLIYNYIDGKINKNEL